MPASRGATASGSSSSNLGWDGAKRQSEGLQQQAAAGQLQQGFLGVSAVSRRGGIHKKATSPRTIGRQPDAPASTAAKHSLTGRVVPQDAALQGGGAGGGGGGGAADSSAAAAPRRDELRQLFGLEAGGSVSGVLDHVRHMQHPALPFPPANLYAMLADQWLWLCCIVLWCSSGWRWCG